MIPGTAPLGDRDPEPITLTIGGFDLVGEGDLWTCEALADGTDLAGNPVPVEVAVQTLIQDGSVSYTEKYDNATITIKVCLSGPDAEALDEGAAALFAELGRPNVLTYTGPQALDAVAWDVVNSHLERNSDDMEELRGCRYYTITLTVLPFRRATVETVTDALAATPPVSGTTTNVDSGSSATGWTGSVNGAGRSVTSSAGVVSVSGPMPPLGQPWTMTLTRAGAIDTSTQNILVVDWQARYTAFGTDVLGSQFFDLTATVGVELTKIAQGASPTAGFTRTWFQTTETALTKVTFQAKTPNPQNLGLSGGTISLFIDNVDKTNISPTVGPGQQLLRSITIDGSARTPGAIAIEHETNALGDVLAFFWKEDGTGYTPPLRQFRVSGGSTPTADTAMVSGAREPLNPGTVTFDIQAARVPRDGYLLVARLGGIATTGTVTWTATTRVNSVDLGPTLTGTQSVTSTVAYQAFPLAVFQLPTRDLDESPNAIVRVTLSASAAILLDEAWLFRDSGQLVHVDCGTGTPSSGGPSKRLFIEPISLSRPRPTLRRGHAADRSDSFFPPSLATSGAWDFPEFTPPRVNVFTVTPNTTGASVSFRHFKRLAG